MKIEQVHRRLSGIPHMSEQQAETMTEFILREKPKSIIELGFFHGVSTCYMAAALDELSEGKITTIDLESARKREPNIENLLSELGLRERVDVYYEPTSYLWRLMKLIEDDPTPRYDLCYLDGAHSWNTDGFAFYLVDRLLKPGGWIIFDDIDWSYEKSPALKDTVRVQKMPPDERSALQVRKIYELLVKPHPAYSDFSVKDGWAYAKKINNGDTLQPTEVRQEIIYQKERYGLGAYLKDVVKGIRRKFQK